MAQYPKIIRRPTKRNSWLAMPPKKTLHRGDLLPRRQLVQPSTAATYKTHATPSLLSVTNSSKSKPWVERHTRRQDPLPLDGPIEGAPPTGALRDAEALPWCDVQHQPSPLRYPDPAHPRPPAASAGRRIPWLGHRLWGPTTDLKPADRGYLGTPNTPQ